MSDAPIKAWPESDLESCPNCPICGDAQRELLYSDLKDKLYRAPGIWHLYKCSACSGAWLDPRPTANSLGRAYASYYTHYAAEHPIVRRRGLMRRLVHDAINGYRVRRYGVSRYPANQLTGRLIPMIPSLKAAVDSQCRHLTRAPPLGGRLLDVGFGDGGFMRIAQDMGWLVEGVDFDPNAVAAARAQGLDVRIANAETLSFEPSRYHVITLSHVLEHLHNPARMLNSLLSALRPGGTLWLETPNLASTGHRRFGIAWRGLEPPRHLVLFSGAGLVDLMRSTGFIDIQRRWRGLSVFDVFSASEAVERGADSQVTSRGRKPPFRDILAELSQMVRPSTREFITLTARRPLK